MTADPFERLLGKIHPCTPMYGAPSSPISKAHKWGKLTDPTKTPPTKPSADFQSTFVKLENTWDPAKKEYTANVRLCVRLKAGLKAPKQLLTCAWSGPGLQEQQLFVYPRSNELTHSDGSWNMLKHKSHKYRSIHDHCIL